MSLKFENILLNTMPKSGSVFIRQTIFTTLKNSKIVENLNRYGLLTGSMLEDLLVFMKVQLYQLRRHI